ncbi:protein of unknown function [Hyphomicrobium sp. MC1]|nr:protein of unknown function [Hyphomicrobium sp. MC1]
MMARLVHSLRRESWFRTPPVPPAQASAVPPPKADAPQSPGITITLPLGAARLFAARKPFDRKSRVADC